MKTTSFNMNENGIQMSLTIGINYCNKQRHGSDFDIDRTRKMCINYSLDLIKAYSGLLIASIQRRMQACEQNLIHHLDDIEYADNCGHIIYVRKDNSRGQFNIPSFEAMKSCVKALQQGDVKAFVQNKFWIDQTLKALLNDTEYHHDDLKEFKYSELISLLCELQANPAEPIAF